MSRFFLHLWESSKCIPDEEGILLPGKEAAVRKARQALGELLGDDIKSGRAPLNRCIVITDAEGNTFAQIATADVAQLKKAELVCPR